MKVKQLKEILERMGDNDEVLIEGCGEIAKATVGTIEDVFVINRSGTKFMTKTVDLTDDMLRIPSIQALVLFMDD